MEKSEVIISEPDKKTKVVCLDDSDCIIEEPDITCIVLDTTCEANEGEIIDEPDNKTEETPIFKILFRDKKTYESLSKTIINCLKNIDILSDRDFNLSEMNCEVSVVGGNSKSDLTSIFMIDTEASNKTRTSSKTVPSYSSKFSGVLTAVPVVKKDDDGLQKGRNKCFNCDGDHTIRDCTEPKDYQKINATRSKFRVKGKVDRYHEEIEQRLGHFSPGRMSRELRDALGLRKRDLPAHIYGMRILGYPPGWLEQAKVYHSGITLFDAKGVKIIESDDEEGEVDQQKDKYDIKKIISYPGFNTVASKDIVDTHYRFNAPPQLPMHSKEQMINVLRDQAMTVYKKKKLKHLPGELNKEKSPECLGNVDMEIEADEEMPSFCGPMERPEAPPLPTEEPKEIAPPPPPAEESNESIIVVKASIEDLKIPSVAVRTVSPSIEDLELKQKRLMDALCNASISSETCELSESLIFVPESPVRLKLPGTPDTPSTPSTPMQRNSSMFTVLGTPVLKQVSPFSNLPTNDQFSKGVSDVINFENLPDSTGKYEKMKVLIGKVRKTITKLNNED